MASDKIIKRIQALLALGQSSNEFEANNANAEAQRLISKHQIEQAEIDSAGNIKQEIVSVTINSGSKSNILWKTKLIVALSEVNNCFIYTEKRETLEVSKTNPNKQASDHTVYIVIGSKPNVELVEILFELILNQVEYFAKEFQPSIKSRTVGKSEKNSFKLGIVTRIAQRLKDTKEEVIKEHKELKGSISTALVFIGQQEKEIQQFIETNVGKLKKAPARTVNIRQEAYQAGIKQGDKVALTNRKALK
jgi:hypothetical protein